MDVVLTVILSIVATFSTGFGFEHRANGELWKGFLYMISAVAALSAAILLKGAA